MPEDGSSWRGRLLLLQPRALAAGWEGYVFAALCCVSLALIATGDVQTAHGVSVGSFQAIPIIAAGWLLGDPLLVVVAAFAVLMRVVAALGGEEVLTAAVQVAVVPFLAVVARTAAVAVSAARESGARDSLVSRIARITSSAAPLEEVLHDVLRELAASGLGGGSVALIDERNRLYIAAAEEARPEPARGAQGAIEAAAAEGRTVIVDELEPERTRGGAGAPLRRPGARGDAAGRVRSSIAVPLTSAGQSIGVLSVESPTPGRFGSADATLLEQVAVAISGAVQRAGALRLADQRLQSRVRELTILLDAARGLASSLDLDVIIQTVCRSAAEIVLHSVDGGRRASVIRVRGDEAQIVGDHDETGSSLAGVTFPVAEHPGVERASRSGTTTTAAVDELRGDVRGYVSRLDLSVGAYAPIRVGREPWGVLTVSARRRNDFAPEDIRLLQGIADLTGLAIANSELLEVERLRSQQLREHGERMADLDHVKSEFLRLASHELRGPLAVLRGYVSMLADGSLGRLSPAAEHVVPIMAAKVGEINLLIDQMLETARLEDSRLQLTRETADLRHIVESTVASIRPLAGPTHPIRLELPADRVEAVVDESRLVTIISNLIDNAIKYSPAGGEIKCRVGVEERSAVIEVRDQGLGIAPEDMPRLFTRFGRVVTTENSHIPGTGLGLYLARELTRLHGGDITAVSTPGRGSRFTIRLPLAHEGAASAYNKTA